MSHDTYVVRWMLRRRVIQRCIFNRVRGSDDLGGAFLTLRRPQREARQEAPISEFQFAQGIRNVAASVNWYV